MPHIIVPLDGSALAERALPFAESLARLAGHDIQLVRAITGPRSAEFSISPDDQLERALVYLKGQAEPLHQATGLGVRTRATVADPAWFVLAEAAEPGASIIVMTTHGRSGVLRLLMGSVAERVLRRSPIPVCLVPSGMAVHEPVRLRRILVPLDSSALAQSVTAPAAELARLSGAELVLFHVFEPEDDRCETPTESFLHLQNRLAQVAHDLFGPIKAHLRLSGALVIAEYALGDPATEIIAAADRLQADLIALATHGRSGLDRLRYGSVAETVLRHATAPVMTFGPAAIQHTASSLRVHELATPH